MPDPNPGRTPAKAHSAALTRVAICGNADGDRGAQQGPLGTHTYYVLAGTTPVLVHNCSVGPMKWSERSSSAAPEIVNGSIKLPKV